MDMDMDMDRARELFERVTAGGEEAIDEFITTRATEELFLDFKRSSDNGLSERLTQIDRKNLAKAISGFGNSSGGVVIWGVDCSPGADRADVARAKIPINNVHRFVGNLQGAISGCTIPPHQKVEHRVVAVDDTGTGYVATLIPESGNAPHQVVKPPQYYIRAGSDFVPAPHSVLAGMFGRRPQPHLYHMISISPVKSHNDSLILRLGVLATNGGLGIARDVFFTATTLKTLGDDTKIFWEPTDRENWSGNLAFGVKISFISNEGVRIPPGAFLMPVSLTVELHPPFTDDLQIKCAIGCAESPTTDFEIKNTAVEVDRIYHQYFSAKKAGVINEALEHEIAEALLNAPDREKYREEESV